MKRILMLAIIGLLVCSQSVAQSIREISFTGNYVFVPQYQQMGSGYAVGYNYRVNNWLWLNTDLAYAQSMKHKGDSVVVGDYTLLPLTYLMSGFYVSAVPSIKWEITNRIYLGLGLGPSAAYQSLLYDRYRYLAPNGFFDEKEENIGVDARWGYRLGATANLKVGLNLNEKSSFFVCGKYSDYIDGEQLINIGFGFSYSF